MKRNTVILLLSLLVVVTAGAQSRMDQYNVVWTTQSANSSESMPCGGGDIGLNVWVEDGDLLFYLSRSGTFDENNCMLKLGRVRLKLTPNLLQGVNFRQELMLNDGYVRVTAGEGQSAVAINVWVDVFRPVIHLDVESKKPVAAEIGYESWRYKDRLLRGQESNANSYKWAAPKGLTTKADSIGYRGDQILFYHRNPERTMFDVVVEQQGMQSVRDSMMNPLSLLTFGGMVSGKNMKPAGTYEGVYVDTDYRGWRLRSVKPATRQQVEIALHVNQTKDTATWLDELAAVRNDAAQSRDARNKSREWWNQYWERSYIIINPAQKESEGWKIGRNYQLFRYMLGCNAYGKYPTKFNGGLFTFDPRFTNEKYPFTPDFRNWGGGTMTAQNQRLVYFPMLKSGDFDMMIPQFEFYNRMLRNAELRSLLYWNHAGASFTEQIESFGLPNPSEYGWKRPKGYDPGMEYNAWLEYQWDTALEFCLMILETERYDSADIRRYIPLIESCLTFFDEHYRYLAAQRGNKVLDGEGHLVLYPGSACETYKMAYNATSTIAGLQTVTKRLLELDDNLLSPQKKERWNAFLATIPPLNYREIDGKKTISPAKLWERVNNVESPQLYPVFPWRIYGVARPDIQIALDTYNYDPDMLKFRSHVGWKQDNIFAACLGLRDEAKRLTLLKLGDSERRFPAFWGPGFDWTPDHNWGGSGMIGLQEMLIQETGDTISLMPAWPSEWNVHFKLHVSGGTTVEAAVEDGSIKYHNVSPKFRKKDIKTTFVTE